MQMQSLMIYTWACTRSYNIIISPNMQEAPLMANRANHINHFGTMIPGKMVPQILHTHPILDPKMSPRRRTPPSYRTRIQCSQVQRTWVGFHGGPRTLDLIGAPYRCTYFHLKKWRLKKRNITILIQYCSLYENNLPNPSLTNVYSFLLVHLKFRCIYIYICVCDWWLGSLPCFIKKTIDNIRTRLGLRLPRLQYSTPTLFNHCEPLPITLHFSKHYN